MYSSFLQRGFDQVLHDVCIQNLPVVFALDRAGLVGSDGETHQGIFDLSYLSCIPNMSIMALKNLWSCGRNWNLRYVIMTVPLPSAYPRGQAYRGLKEFDASIEYGKGELLYEGSRIAPAGGGKHGEHRRACAGKIEGRRLYLYAGEWPVYQAGGL